MDTLGDDSCGSVQVDDIGSLSIQVDTSECIDHETPKKDVEELKAPFVGMLFETIEEGKNYYEEYSLHEGFSIRTRTSTRAIRGSNEVTGITFVCSHEGKFIQKAVKGNDERDTTENEHVNKISRSCSTVKCGCKASMRILYDKWTTKWKVSVFNDNHNHKVVTPARIMKMNSNRCMPQATKDLANTFRRENLQVAKVPIILGGTNIRFDDRDYYNHLRNVRHRKLEGGDVQLVLNYFKNKQAQNPQFFYAIQCDEDGRASNFFWVDGRSRMSYQYFGEVVTFDTSYRMNKHDMPFTPFIGVNHHLQPIQFGCALLQDETETTFLWLFETWLEAMGGRHPISIITNQDLAVKGAIAKVFPNTRHRLCLWHIKKKFGEKLPQVYFKKSKFKDEMKKCIWSTFKIEDFEKKWKTLMVEFGLEKNEWLQQLFDIRVSWVPVYNRNTFFAGMNTTGRSEGINSFFAGFLKATKNLREFVVKYDQALATIEKKESDEDFESEHKFRIVNEYLFLLQHAAKLYTRNAFEKFKEEWNKVYRYRVEVGELDNGYHTYIVKTKVGEYEEFVIKLNLSTNEGKCECQMFEFVGILCRHLLKVFARLDIDMIPQHFILERWRQGANKFRLIDSYVMNEAKEQSDALRLNHMCRQTTKLACFASHSNTTYTIFMDMLNELSKKLYGIKSDAMEDPPVNVSQFTNEHGSNNSSQLLLLDPNISQTKGKKNDDKGNEIAHNAGRLKSSIELAQQKKKRRCALCKRLGHVKQICPSNSNRKMIESTLQENEDVQELDRDAESDEEALPLL